MEKTRNTLQNTQRGACLTYNSQVYTITTQGSGNADLPLQYKLVVNLRYFLKGIAKLDLVIFFNSRMTDFTTFCSRNVMLLD